jgi:hypothetical protein
MSDDRTYVKVHDGMPDHPKIVDLTPAAKWALVSYWCYCGRNLTDGFVPNAVAVREGQDVVDELAKAGMIDPVGDRRGWLCHDYLEHQRSAEQVAELKQKRRAAGSRGGRAKANAVASATASAVASASPFAKQSAKQMPWQTGSKVVADTDTDTDKEQVLAPSARNRDELFEAVAEACRIDIKELTPQGRGPLNQAVKQLRTVGASPTQVKIRANRYRLTYPETTLTPSALSKHWAQLNGTKPAATAEKVNRGW